MRKWLKEAREDAGLSMKQFGEKLGISESYYSCIENGTRQKKMDLNLVIGISSVLGIPINQITELEVQENANKI